MAKLNFNDVATSTSASNTSDLPGFFSLKNDGDSAIVRIMHESLDDLDIIAMHDVQIRTDTGMVTRKVSCLRNMNDPISSCPLCGKEVKRMEKIYIHLLVYTVDETGNVTVEPKIWERNASGANGYAMKLKNLMSTYGKLSDCIFSIRRNGVKGSMQTTYDFNYMPPQMYPEEKYPKRYDLFENYSAFGTVVQDRSYDDIQTFLATGAFPQKASVNEGTYSSVEGVGLAPNEEAIFSTPMNNGVAPSTPNPQYGGYSPAATTGGYAPQPTNGEARPARYY